MLETAYTLPCHMTRISSLSTHILSKINNALCLVILIEIVQLKCILLSSCKSVGKHRSSGCLANEIHAFSNSC